MFSDESSHGIFAENLTPKSCIRALGGKCSHLGLNLELFIGSHRCAISTKYFFRLMQMLFCFLSRTSFTVNPLMQSHSESPKNLGRDIRKERQVIFYQIQ